MQFSHLRFYVPIVLLWGSVTLSAFDPVLVQSNVRFDSDVEPGDLMQLRLDADIMRDELVVYRLNWTDYVGQVIGLDGDEIVLGLDGNSIIRNGERIEMAARGAQIRANDSGIVTLGPGEAAVLVQSFRRDPSIFVISEDSIRGSVDRIYRYSELSQTDWRRIGFFTVVVASLILLPFAGFSRPAQPSMFRIVFLVAHTFTSLAVVGVLIATSLPGDPLGLGAVEPVWWWFPLAVVSGFRLDLLLVVILFVGIQWLGLKLWRLRR